MKTPILFVLFGICLQTALATPTPRKGFDWEPLNTLAIQERGRLKPLHTFAEESVLFVTGKRQWKDMKAMEVLFSWLIAYDKDWENEAFIKISYNPLKKEMGLPEDESYFSPEKVRENEGFRKLMREAAQKEQRKEKLSELEKKAVILQNQRALLEGIVMGQIWALLPNPSGIDKPWFPLASLTDAAVSLPYGPEETKKLAESVRDLLGSYIASDAKAWNTAVQNFSSQVRTGLAREAYPALSTMQREVQYNQVRPFRVSWILYACAFVLFCIFNVTANKIAKYASAAAISAGFLIHAYGFIVRCLIAGRPPVTNMYESVIWVTWGCVLFSLIIWAVYKNAVIPTAACVFAVIGLVLADNLPFALDPSIQPLEPVLRSNFWLTIHVLTITMSYAAFALSLCIGNVVLGNYLWRPTNKALLQNYSLYMYRAMQIGVVLLAAGTILGGVWADYSWGRFWGWDPKEVWALVALLLYLAVLHGRFSGLLKGFGFAASAVISFLGVLMAWYGVNFVLGVGLHSYGFGTGGISYVVMYVVAQLAFIVAAYVRYRKSRAPGSVEPAIFPRT